MTANSDWNELRELDDVKRYWRIAHHREIIKEYTNVYRENQTTDKNFITFVQLHLDRIKALVMSKKK